MSTFACPNINRAKMSFDNVPQHRLLGHREARCDLGQGQQLLDTSNIFRNHTHTLSVAQADMTNAQNE